MAKTALLPRLLLPIAVLTAYLTTNDFPSSTLYDRPLHTLIFTFAICGFLLSSLGRALPSLFTLPLIESKYSTILLDDRDFSFGSPTLSSPTRARHDSGVSTSRSRGLFLGAILALTLRVELYRRISNAPECTAKSAEVFLPVLCGLYEAIHHGQTAVVDLQIPTLARNILRSRFRYLPSAMILSVGSYTVFSLWSASTSTYICPLVGRQGTMIALFQILATLIDSFLAIAVVEFSLPFGQVSSSSRPKGPVIWASVLLATATIWFTIGVIVYFAVPELRSWLLPFDLIFSIDFVSSQIAQALLLSTLCISALACIVHFGLLYTAMSLTAVCAVTPALDFIWSNRHNFALASPTTTLIGFVLIYLGWRLFEFSRQCLGLDKQHSMFRQVIVLLLLFALTYPCWSASTRIDIHPIDDLIRKADVQHKQYLQTLRAGNSLADAVMEYKRRYSMRPPPGFDIWYEYATNRSATIIDEFDQIHQDLLPFRVTSPADLRRQTWEMVSNPWNGISGITIRNGEAKVQDNVLPTHRWMLEGVAHLINAFSRYLPDMDLAFNLNDESRIAVQFSELSKMRDQAQKVELKGTTSWSKNRSEGWLPIPEVEYHETNFIEASFQNTFSKYGSIGCDPKSKARRSRQSSSRSHMCLDCVKPHSNGQFISNWSLAANICHQPDLSHMHGFYLSPAAFKTSFKLMPVFSQSKPHGYNDILYPSAWNYMDKVIYEPSQPSGGFPGEYPDDDFRSKESVLFWRGATSEGVSNGNRVWQGMTRQRLVHMANNLTYSEHDHATILLPDGDHYRYRTIPGPLIKDLGLKADMKVVDGIARCGGVDCVVQKAEFDLVPPTDFQAHWKYRYLFDLDGAGFSGRFLPFLESKSLPFKSALFREWYDSRLTAWQHFVPQDVRLHGVWSTLAYFAGIDGVLNGRKIKMAPHLEEGEKIANAGREWGGKVLRKEDMELYFFRLLLEWGRLTDDNRDNLGFSI